MLSPYAAATPTGSGCVSPASVTLRLTVLRGQGLAAKDRNGTSDPYLVVTIGESRAATSMIRKTLDPEWNQTLEFALNGPHCRILEAVCWDKDRIGKDYMGEFEIDLAEWDGAANEIELPLRSTRSGKDKNVTGSIFIKMSIDGASTDRLRYLLTGSPSGLGTRSPSYIKLSSFLPRRKKKQQNKTYSFSSHQPIDGMLFLELVSISDLPPEKNRTRTSFDMDPFVVISLGKQTFRSQVIRHCLNPVYNEKFCFAVHPSERSFRMYFDVVDLDKMSGNDSVGAVDVPLADLLTQTPSPDEQTGLYPVKLSDSPPSPSIPGKRRFWSRDKSGTATPTDSSTPVSAQPSAGPASSAVSTGSLGPVSSSLYNTTIAVIDGTDKMETLTITDSEPARLGISNPGFDFQQFQLPLKLKNQAKWENVKPVLTIKAKYIPYNALRQQFWLAMLKLYDTDGSGRINKTELLVMLDALGSTLSDATIDGFFERFPSDGEEEPSLSFEHAVICLEDKLKELSSRSGGSSEVEESGSDSDSEKSTREHIIEIADCPLCHQPRMNKRSESDILVHLATCANLDWRNFDRAVASEYATSSQARRKWVSRMLNKVGYGGYKIGANSANILVQDRESGRVFEERMSRYIRLSIRILYKGTHRQSLEMRQLRRVLEKLSYDQGAKFDDPASVREIEGFIRFHQLNMDEVLKPLDQFTSFNDFFYRELEPGSRPLQSEDPCIAVSPADCRTVVFPSITAATTIWVKGRDFTIKKLLAPTGTISPETQADVDRYSNGSLGIFRLAPQDYHRFHFPVDGFVGTPQLIKGEYYTVNPMAIRSRLDVYGDNVRVLVPIDSTHHGRVMVICVGAMMVGSTVITANPNTHVRRGDELGYFRFGGSTLLVLFEKGAIQWDADLESSSRLPMETLVRVGMSIGRVPGAEPAVPQVEVTGPPVEQPAMEGMGEIEGEVPAL